MIGDIMVKKNVKVCDDSCCGDNCCKNSHGNFVGIGASLAGILMIITVLFLIFAREQLEYLAAIAWGIVILGIFLGLFTLLAIKRQNK
jgi:hypothetical protein